MALCPKNLLPQGHSNTTPGNCETTFDSVLCWPESRPNVTVQLPCPPLGDYEFDPNGGFAFRLCQMNGTWSSSINYSGCIPLNLQEEHEMQLSDLHIRLMYSMYWTGYVISLVICIFALAILAHYKNLWCIRNMIHWNAILCFALHNTVWILYSLIRYELHLFVDSPLMGCAVPLTLLKYFICAAFFWMFVEGAYIFINVLFTYHAHKIRFWMCAIVGWGLPFLLICLTFAVDRNRVGASECERWSQSESDFIFILPMLIIICLNVCFLVVIMYVILSKLRLSVRTEFDVYRKGARALLILCPLLGINYLFVLYHPHHPWILSLIIHYYTVIISSVQGFLFAMFFCFRNKEVEECLRRSFAELRLSLKMRAEIRRHGAQGHTQSGDHSQITLLSLSSHP